MALVVAGALLLVASYIAGWTSSNLVLLTGLIIIILGAALHIRQLKKAGNKYVHVSPPIFVELVAPHRGVRYTATVKVDHRGKNGSACLQTIVRQNGQLLVKPVEFTVDVRKH